MMPQKLPGLPEFFTLAYPEKSINGPAPGIQFPKLPRAAPHAQTFPFLKRELVYRTRTLDAPTVFDRFLAFLSKLRALFWVSAYRQQPLDAVSANCNRELRQTCGVPNASSCANKEMH